MIAFLTGILGESWNTSCIVITASGVGYLVTLPGHTFLDLPPKGEKISFYISMVTREDAQELFGFATFEERRTFEVLKSVSKVGSRTALAILTAFRPGDLRQIILEENIGALTSVSGIGKKTAQHIMLELRYKLENVPPSGTSSQSGVMPSLFEDVMAALSGLGYGEQECAPIVKDIIKEEPDLDEREVLRAVLKFMAKGKS